MAINQKKKKKPSERKYARMLDLVVSLRWGCVGGIFFFSLCYIVLISYLILAVRGEKGKNLSSFQPLLIFNDKDIRLS